MSSWQKVDEFVVSESTRFDGYRKFTNLAKSLKSFRKFFRYLCSTALVKWHANYTPRGQIITCDSRPKHGRNRLKRQRRIDLNILNDKRRYDPKTKEQTLLVPCTQRTNGIFTADTMGSHHAGCPAIIVCVNMKIDPRVDYGSREDFRRTL